MHIIQKFSKNEEKIQIKKIVKSSVISTRFYRNLDSSGNKRNEVKKCYLEVAITLAFQFF